MKKFEVKYLMGGYSDGENYKKQFDNYDEAKKFLQELRDTNPDFTVGRIYHDGGFRWMVRNDGKDFGFGNPKKETAKAA